MQRVSPFHSHSHSEAISAGLGQADEGMRALAWSFAGLGATAAIQTVIVVISGSVALLADTVHNYADALTSVPLAVAFWVGRRPATKRYTYGFGRAEDLAGLFIVAAIAISTALAAWKAITGLVHPQAISRIGWVAGAGLLGFAGNELVAAYRIKVGKRIGSAALVADGLHARADGLTSLAVVAGAGGVAAGFELADPIAGLAITLALLFVLKDAATQMYGRLMDSVDPSIVDQMQAVLSEVPGIEGIDQLRVRWIGHDLHAEAQIVSDCELSIAQAHDIAESAHHRLLHEVPRLAQVTIHTSPCTHDGRDPHSAIAHHFD